MATSDYRSGKSADPASRSEQLLDTATETVGDLKQQADEFAGDLKNTVRKSVEVKPFSTLAVAAALGFVLGAVWKS